MTSDSFLGPLDANTNTSRSGYKGVGTGGAMAPTGFSKACFGPPLLGQLAQVETISQSYIHRNTYIHTRSHTTSRTSTGITSPPPLESSTTVKPFTVTPESAYNFIYDQSLHVTSVVQIFSWSLCSEKLK